MREYVRRSWLSTPWPEPSSKSLASGCLTRLRSRMDRLVSRAQRDEPRDTRSATAQADPLILEEFLPLRMLRRCRADSRSTHEITNARCLRVDEGHSRRSGRRQKQLRSVRLCSTDAFQTLPSGALQLRQRLTDHVRPKDPDGGPSVLGPRADSTKIMRRASQFTIATLAC
jgi:hypothetical protein